MASSITLPLMPNAELLALNNDAPRAVFEYVDGKRSDTQRVHPVTGRKLYRVRALLKLTAVNAEEVSVLLDSDAPLGGALRPVKFDPATAQLSIRPEDAFNLALTLTVSLLTEKGGGA
ncbi:MAG: hypothetical protein ACTJGT_04650 [Microbacteriaceae bacterium]